MQRPWKLHMSLHLGTEQSIPANISLHWHVPSSSLHLPFSVLELQSSLQVFSTHPTPANFCPWNAGFTSTKLHTHVELMHTPFPLQLFGQYFSEQSRPRYPGSHLHFPSFMQRPWKLHISGHFGVAQSIPANNSLHAQVPSSSLHTPFSVFLLQSSLQVFPWHPAPANFCP